MLGHAVVRQKRGCEDRRIGRGARRAGAVCTLSAQSRFLRGAIKKDSEYSRDPIKRLAKSSICLKRFTSHLQVCNRSHRGAAPFQASKSLEMRSDSFVVQRCSGHLSCFSTPWPPNESHERGTTPHRCACTHSRLSARGHSYTTSSVLLFKRGYGSRDGVTHFHVCV